MIELYVSIVYLVGVGVSGGAFWALGFDDPICDGGHSFLMSILLWPLIMPVWISWKLTILTIDKIRG